MIFTTRPDIRTPATALDSLKYSHSRTNLWLYSKMETIDRIKINPARFARYLASKTPFFLFFFSPVIRSFFLAYLLKKEI